MTDIMGQAIKLLAMVLALVVLSGPLAAAAACGDSHETDCVADCSCVCCNTAPASLCHDRAGLVIAMIATRPVISDPRWLGILLAADIFRPPITA
jgi:hypothetical protein